jgi:hypothetical protein
MSSNVYLRRGGELVAMRETPYEAETVLQELLAEHPELLVTDDGGDRRLLLVRRETPLSDAAEQVSAGWLDHLFLDRDGVPTLVEVKRSGNAGLRREVVGQLLEYAANAAACWREDAVRRWFEERCAAEGEDPAQALAAVFADLADIEAYWSEVRANLAAGRLRLMFVADDIPASLRRIVEFLNAQMHETEVMALEVRQYVDADGRIQTLVPRVVGQTAASSRARRPAARRWDREAILAELAQRHGDDAAGVGEALMEWAAAQGLQAHFGSGSRDGSFQAGLQDGRSYLWPFTIFTSGWVEISFQYIARRPPFDDRDLREQLRRELTKIPGVALPPASLDKRPSFPIGALADDAARAHFCAAMEWAFAQCGSGGAQ